MLIQCAKIDLARRVYSNYMVCKNPIVKMKTACRGFEFGRQYAPIDCSHNLVNFFDLWSVDSLVELHILKKLASPLLPVGCHQLLKIEFFICEHNVFVTFGVDYFGKYHRYIKFDYWIVNFWPHYHIRPTFGGLCITGSFRKWPLDFDEMTM